MTSQAEANTTTIFGSARAAPLVPRPGVSGAVSHPVSYPVSYPFQPIKNRTVSYRFIPFQTCFTPRFIPRFIPVSTQAEANETGSRDNAQRKIYSMCAPTHKHISFEREIYTEREKERQRYTNTVPMNRIF